MALTEKQNTLVEKLQKEYDEYIENLRARGKYEIISESQRTTFYANILLYAQSHSLFERDITALSTPDALNGLYMSYLSNEQDYLEMANTSAKAIYQFRKEQEYKKSGSLGE